MLAELTVWKEGVHERQEREREETSETAESQRLQNMLLLVTQCESL